MEATTTPKRLVAHLPIVAGFALKPISLGFVLLFVAGLVSFISVHYGLMVLLLAAPFISYYLERNLLDRVLLPPFSIIAFWSAVSSGVGIALITFSRGGIFDPSLLQIQVAAIFTLIVGWFFYRLGFGKIPKMHFPEFRGAFERDVVRPLTWVGWFFLFYTVVRTLINLQSGNLDRGEASVAALGGDHFGYWTFFNIFPRFNNLCFFLAPLMWRPANPLGRVLILGLLGIYFLIALVSGSRGILIYPMIYIVVGMYFFRSLRFVKLDILGILALVILLPLIVIIDAFRNTDAYKTSSTGDIFGRLAAFDDAFERLTWQARGGSSRGELNTLGKALLGRSDSLIYQSVNYGYRYVGFENLDAVLYTFVPTYLVRNKPLLIDSNVIYWELIGVNDGTGRGMSLAADSYRRFGWIGVPVFVGIFFWMYGWICGRFYRWYFVKDAFFGILLILFSFSFFQAAPFSSVLETWWHMSYNMVKHIAALFVGAWALRLVLNIRNRGGLNFYMQTMRGESK